jgi:hypothetical protein
MPREIKQEAIDLVMDFEKKQGRNPKNVSRTGHGYDIESSGRLIEVKGMSHPTGDFIMLYKKLFVKLGRGISNYYIYVVFDIKNKPKLKIIPPEVILANLEIETSFFLKAKSYKDIKAIDL